MSLDLRTKYLATYYSKNGSLSIGLDRGRINVTAWPPRNSDSRKPISSVTLSSASVVRLCQWLTKIHDTPPDTRLPIICKYVPRDSKERKDLAVINVFKDDKNRIGIEITNAITSKSLSVLVRAPASFGAGNNEDNAEYTCECEALVIILRGLVQNGMILTGNDKAPDRSSGGNNSESSRSSNSSNSSSSSNNDDDELW